MAAAVNRGTSGDRPRRLATWGAASAMKAMGPAAAVAMAVRATAAITMVSRVRGTLTPSWVAASSPSSSRLMRRAHHSTTGTMAMKPSAAGATCAHVRALSEPASQRCAATARSRSP